MRLTASTLEADPDRTTFELAILTVSPILRGFALRLTNNHAAAEDLVQDTLIKAWAARSRFQTGSNTTAWLFRIARNTFLSNTRRTRRQVAWDPDRHPMLLIQAATQDDALYSRDLLVALSRLPASQREALLLVSRDCMSIADAAEHLGVPPSTVKSRVARARASLIALVDGGIATAGRRSGEDVFARPDLRARDTICDFSKSSDRPKRPQYEEWKASRVTTIG